MILRSKTIDLNKLDALAGAYGLRASGSCHDLKGGAFKGGTRIDFKLELIEATPRDPDVTAKYQRRGYMKTKNGKGQKVRAVCWHGHRDVMKSIFAYDPDARLQSGLGPRSIDYRGAADFERSYPATGDINVGSLVDPRSFRSMCDCEASKPRGIRVFTMKQSDIQQCPHYILSPDHYREDGSCKCDDKLNTIMAEWGYHWSDEEGSWT